MSSPEATSMLRPLPLSQVRVEGELRDQLLTLYDRLEEPLYRYPAIATCGTANGCPGDWYGRAILALSLLAQATGRAPRHLDELMLKLPSHINADGYFGRIVEDIAYDEGRTASHQFLLSGLCEYSLWKRDSAALALAERIAASLFLPVAGVVASYPDAEDRGRMERKDLVIGAEVGQLRRWKLFSDTGVLFFALDGLSQVLELTGSPALGPAIEAMVARYRRLDPVSLQAQTHATLTTARGILRLAALRSDAGLLALGRHLYDRYRKEGMTEDYQNHNWFGRPEWTEGCAVVDSVLVAGQLWLMTKEAGYLRDLHRILFTGLRHNQYANGGFGTTSCLGSRRRQDDSETHSPQAVLRRGEEATWCCSMRGASALAFAAQMSWCTDGERLIAPIAIPGTATVQLNQGSLVLRQTTDYPYDGQVRIEILRSEVNAPVPLAFFLPDADGSGDCHMYCDGKELDWTWHDGFAEVTVPLRTGTILVLESALQPRIESLEVPERLPGHVRLMHGPLMLGSAASDRTEPGPPSTWTYQGGGAYRTASGLTLAPLGMRSYRDQEDSLKRPTRFLFQDPAGGRA